MSEDKYSEYELSDQVMFLGVDWAYPFLWGIDLKSTYKSLWLGWWLVTWTYDDGSIGDFNISFQPDL